MPDPALENVMLGALQNELQKIGTVPLSNWLTQTAPTLKLGVPGDTIPGPNLMTMWLQHLATEFLDAEGGTATHRIRATFGVWCCSSHPDSCMVRALNLRTDVIRTLFAAEGTFSGLFEGGEIWPGNFTFQGYEAYIRAGAYMGMQEVFVLATVPHDLSLLADPSMLSFDLERTMLRSYAFAVLPTAERISPTFMRQQLQAPALIIESTTPGANKIAEVRIEENIDGKFFVGPNLEDWSQYAAEIACNISPAAASNATDTMFCGIELGTYNQVAPFPSTANNAVAQLRWNYGLSRWELVSGVGDGVTADTVVALTGLPTPVPGGGYRCRLVYDPFFQKLQAFVNGVLGAEITDPAKLPQFLAYANSPLVSGAFVTTGASNAAFVQAIFSACHCKLYNTTLPAAVLWY